jgi:anti-sigma regulatory factor (Ser/Thr protein kinase)
LGLMEGRTVTHTAEHRLPHEPAAAEVARELAREIAGPLPSDRAYDFVLMTSEIVANAVRHAPPENDGQIALRFELDSDVIRAIVMDGGGDFAFEKATFDASTQRYGLQMVDRLANRWGLSLDGEKAVWFEVDT